MKHDCLTASETKLAFESAGLIGALFIRELSLASFHDRIFSHGFQTVHVGEKSVTEISRSSLNIGRTWRVFSLPFYENTLSSNRYEILNSGWDGKSFNYRVHRKSNLDKRPPATVYCWLNCHKGTMGWEIQGSSAVAQQWSNVMFDRISVEKFLSEYQKRAQANTLQDSEIVVWIEGCGTRNSKIAWAKFKNEYGGRTGKKATFESLWPKQPVGRPSSN